MDVNVIIIFRKAADQMYTGYVPEFPAGWLAPGSNVSSNTLADVAHVNPSYKLP
jgi:hypothetical protein